MSYNYVIFDLDGTILNTLDDLYDSVNFALSAFSLPLRTKHEITTFVGNGIKKLIERSVPENTDKALTESVYFEFNKYYKLHSNDKTKPYDGITELINLLRNNGKKIAVVSNKVDYAAKSLCSLHFPDAFDYVIGQQENIRKKPYPDSVNAVIEYMGANKSETVYIGDSEIDIATAKNADIDCISVLWGFRTRSELINSGASVLASDTKDLEKLIFN